MRITSNIDKFATRPGLGTSGSFE